MAIFDLFNTGSGNIGVDIGSSSIKIVEIKEVSANSVVLSKYANFEIPRNLINVNFNDSILLDKLAFRDLFLEKLKEMKISNQKMNITFSDSNALINWLNIKLKKDETLETSIEDKLITLFPSDISNWQYNWQTLEEKKDSFIILCEAILKDNMIELGTLFQGLKMWPHVMDISCFNALNLFHNHLISSENNKKNISLVSIGNDSTTVMIFNNGILKSFRVIPVGGKDFTSAIADTLGKTYEDSEEYKINQRFFLREYSDEQNKLENYTIIKNVFGEIVKGVYNSFDSYLAKFREFKIHKIILFGGTANFRNINVLLQKHLNIPVILGSDLVSIKYKGEELSADEKNVLVSAVGSLLRD